MSIQSPISGPSTLTTKVSEELSNSDLSQLEYEPQVPAPSEIFENQDILGVVLEHFEDDQSLGATRKSLLFAALTSKAFLEPAMNSLWSSLDSLMPLLNLLPSFVSINNVYVFAEVIAEGQWERFDYYARRVKFLTALAPRPSKSTITVSEYVYLRIAQVRSSHSSSPLFPALQRLCIPNIPNPPSSGSLGSSIGLSAAFLVSSPSLESVELHSQATSDPQFLASYLSFLAAELAPTLRCLILRGNPRTDSLTLLRHLRNIRTLEISFAQLSFSPELFCILAGLEHLSDLTIELRQLESKRGKGMGFKGADRVPLLKLDQLKNLQITGRPNAISHVLSQLRAPRLKSMVINIRAQKTNESLNASTSLYSEPECFEGIAHSPSISSFPITQTKSSFVILTIADIRPILTLSQLEELDISVYSMTSGDEVLQEISSNLPNLKTLILPSIPSGQNQVGFFGKNSTFHSLEILACNCPDLIQLKLAIDLLADFPSSHNNTAAVRQRSHPLKELYIGDAKPSAQPLTTTQLIVISRYIDRVFSNLEFVGRHGSGDKFTEVDEIRSAFQANRRDVRESLVEKTPQLSYVSKATQTIYMPVAGGTDFTLGKSLKTLPFC